FSYYLNQSNAENDVNPISNFYDLPNTATSRTIWVRVYELNNPCVYVTSFDLSFINCVIELNRLSNLSICEGASVQTFDLTVQTPLVYNNAVGYSVDYYTTQNDAIAAQNAIPTTSLANYNGFHGERIWVRVTNTSNSQVYGVTSFFLYRYLLPQVQTNYPALTACEIGSSGLGSFELNLAYKFIPVTSAGTSLEFYATQQEATQGDASLSLPSQYTGAAGTLYVRVVNLDGGCFVVVPLQLQIINSPIINPVGPISECDLNNDGFTTFNLDPYRVLIAGNPLPAHGVVSFHETQADADNNVNAISNTGTYTNKVRNQQTIYARVGYTNSSCYATIPITLIVNKTPPITPIGTIFVCDINNDNVETVDLTANESELLTGLIATNYTVTYHISSNAAMAGTGAIGSPSNFSTSTSHIVYVRVTDKITGCFAVTSIEMQLVDLPSVNTPLPTYKLCDSNGNGFETFNLGGLIPSIVGSQQGVDVSFHYTQADAEEGTPSLPLQYQNVSPNLQTIYVRVFNSSTGCFVITTLTLEVVANPELTLPMEPYVICNANGNYGTINIYLYGKALVDATGQNYAFHFYETQSDAENGLNQITNPIAYNNLQPTNPVVWIRVTNTTTGCWSVYPMAFQLVVPPRLPSNLLTIEECDVFGNKQDGVTLFDLSQQDAALIAAQNVTGTYQIRYFTSQTSANSNTNWIGNPTQFQNTSNPQTIWVRIENSDLPGSCSRVMSFDILVRAPHVLYQPLPIVLCDTQLPNDGQRVFDLRLRERDILGGQPFQTVVTYHLSQQEADNGINAIADPSNFTNTVNPQTIYVSAVNQYGCRSVITMTVRVLPLPEPNLNPDPLEACQNPGGNTAFFDLTDAEPNLSNFSNYTYSYFTDEIGAQTNDPASRINNPEGHLSETGSVFVRVTNSFNDTNATCFAVVELPLIVHPVPIVGPMTTLAACMDNPTLTTSFNLRDKDEQALAGNNPDDYIVRYFGNEDDATNGVNPLPYIYTNIIDVRQLIWVRVEHKETGCWQIASFLIQIEQSVIANRPSNPEFCETDYENDGVSLVDLSTLDIEIIGNQTATNLIVNYYRADGSLITPSNAGQVHHGEVIRAEVRSANPNLVCNSFVEFVVRLKDAPEVLPLKDGVVCYEYRDQWSIVSGHYLDTGVQGSGYTFVWTRNAAPITEDAADILEGGRVLYAKRGGSYEVVVTGQNGCSTMRRALVDEAPSITIDEVKITDSFGDTNAVEVIAYAGPNFTNIEYKMDNGPWQDSNIFLDVTAGEHTIYVRIEGQPCVATKVITVMDYPKFFTPNGDGYNDTWNIWSLKDQPMSKIYIFDRYGKLLKEISPAGEGWDGTLNGHPLPSTDYWFKAEYIDPKTGLQKEVTGHFSLKR
ncbi:MAG: T9SS type B sorting domain-containing protein, partial [Acholeplasmataceae bacterium]